jgi:hypothetical protein
MSHPLKTGVKIYTKAIKEVLTPDEREKVRILIIKNRMIDLEGPEKLTQKVAAAVRKQLKSGQQ